MVEMTTSPSQHQSLPPMSDDLPDSAARGKHPSRLQEIGQQPILITSVVLALLVAGIGGIFGWRAYSGANPEPERLTAARLQQARVAQASEQIIEKTKGIEATQQQSIDQLQVVQDQLLTMQRLMAAQQNDTRKLTEQVGTLTTTLDNLRQSFASVPATNDDAQGARNTARRSKSHPTVASRNRTKPAAVQRKRGR